jgi:hypothetical protein
MAQTPDAKVNFFIDPANPAPPYTVGDQITLHLEIKHPADSRVVLPQLDPQWESFEIISQTPPETINAIDGSALTRKDIVVALFAPGQFQTPRLVITHRKPDGAVEELAAPVIALSIASVLTQDTTLRDIKPQANLPLPPLWPWLLGGLLLAALLTGLLVAAYGWLRRRWQARPVGPAPIPVPVDTRPPEVIAHAELNRIEALDLPAQNQLKQHYSLVADCLRRYVEGRYAVPALEQTTTELRAAFRQLDLPMRPVSSFMSVFAESDLVKFARYQPNFSEVGSLINRARAVVDVTTPAPAPVAPEIPQVEATPK